MNDNVLFFLKYKKDVQFFYDTLSLAQALPLMKKYGYAAVPVINSSGEYLGSVSEGDFLWFVLQQGYDHALLEETTVSHLVRKDFMPAVNISVPFEHLLDTSFHQNYVPVIDDRNIFIGIVTRQSLLKYLAGQRITLTIPQSALDELVDSANL